MWQNWDLNPGSLTVGSVSLAKTCSASRKAKGAGPRTWDSGGRILTSHAGGWEVCGPVCSCAHHTMTQLGSSTRPSSKASGSKGEDIHAVGCPYVPLWGQRQTGLKPVNL